MPLSLSSNAYRFSGFGSHEIVVYYDMVRHLLGECFEDMRRGFSPEAEIERLEKLKAAWLDVPHKDYSSRRPSHVIEWERKRVNMTMSAKEYVIDEDCEMCEALAVEFDTPVFWGLDGSSMDEGFEFSFYKTLEEFEAEERRREEFNREFERDWKVGKYNQPFDESSIDFDEPPF
ncbi:MAG: hypothetical protein AUG51_08775 [Acidobacteria bacterium 13_1_20CM_3_53_8]|nr:MAG: hypothetical protein AUG51_08775 [Acidobacteria bacterium 13_1_20CM_3_53_8]